MYFVKFSPQRHCEDPSNPFISGKTGKPMRRTVPFSYSQTRNESQLENRGSRVLTNQKKKNATCNALMPFKGADRLMQA